MEVTSGNLTLVRFKFLKQNFIIKIESLDHPVLVLIKAMYKLLENVACRGKGGGVCVQKRSPIKSFYCKLRLLAVGTLNLCKFNFN